MQHIVFVSLFTLLVLAPPYNEACSRRTTNNTYNLIGGNHQIGSWIGGRADDNADFSTLPESIKQCVYRRSASDTKILREVNLCSKNGGGVNCVKAIAGVKTCFE